MSAFTGVLAATFMMFRAAAATPVASPDIVRSGPTPITPAAARPRGSASASAKRSRWDARPFVRPVAGVSVWGGGGGTPTSVGMAGAAAGIVYRERGGPKPRWRVVPRVLGQIYQSNAGVAGFQGRLGVQAGPSWGTFGVRSGPDLFHDRLRVADVRLDPATGVAWPLMGIARFGALGLQAGVEPSWFLMGDRPGVDWDKTSVPGVGDEFAYRAGANLRLQKSVVGLHWSHRVTSAGSANTWGISAGFRL